MIFVIETLKCKQQAQGGRQNESTFLGYGENSTSLQFSLKLQGLHVAEYYFKNSTEDAALILLVVGRKLLLVIAVHVNLLSQIGVVYLKVYVCIPWLYESASR